MHFDIISTIEIETVRYRYTLNHNMTRDIDTQNPKKEIFTFKFDSDSIEKIIFREGPAILFVDGKSMYFNYKNNTLSGIHFEDNTYVWIVNNYKDFINQCKEAYLGQKISEKILVFMNPPSYSKSSGRILDEFEDDYIESQFDEEED